MKQIISIIIDRQGESRIRFRVFVYGSITTTGFTFDNSNFTQEDLRRAVNETRNDTRALNETQEAPGTTDLQQALAEAEILFNLTSRANVTKAFIVLDSETGPAYRVWKIKCLVWNRVRIWRNGTISVIRAEFFSSNLNRLSSRRGIIYHAINLACVRDSTHVMANFVTRSAATQGRKDSNLFIWSAIDL